MSRRYCLPSNRMTAAASRLRRAASASEGATAVIRHDDAPEVLAVNVLDDGFSASAAIAGDELYLRGERYLYCIAEEG